jgi:hypothetical protein
VKRAGNGIEAAAWRTVGVRKKQAFGWVALCSLAFLAIADFSHAIVTTDKCHAGKLGVSSKYMSCRLKTEAKAARDGVLSPDFSKCEGSFEAHFANLEANAGPGVCPTEDDDQVASDLEQCDGNDLRGTTCASIGYSAGGTLACTPGCGLDTSACACSTCVPGVCGDGAVANDEQCDGANLDGTTCATLGYDGGGTLSCTSGCGFDTSDCECTGRLTTSLLLTGQTKCYTANAVEAFCAGSGQDGDVLAGAARQFVDNGDGTITDSVTNLMWEKNSDDGSIHDMNNLYSWANAFSGKIATLNSTAFAGHADWRLPNIFELDTLVHSGVSGVKTWPAFNSGCQPGCTVLTCSCMGVNNTWSSTTVPQAPAYAYFLIFSNGVWSGQYQPAKSYTSIVRAVRGGL